MMLLFIICMCIVGCLMLFGGGATIFWVADRYEGYRALLAITFSFVLAYIVITGMVHIVRIYFRLPILPWEFADIKLGYNYLCQCL